MAGKNLNYRVTADTEGFVQGMKKVRKTMHGTVRGSNKQSQAFTQLAYALDDAQYGFRGVQNNLQQIAVTMGLKGPLIIGITAILIAINFFAERWKKASKEAKEAAVAQGKALADAQGPIVKMQLYADTVKSADKASYEYKDALEKLKKLGFDPLNGSVDEFVKKKSAMIKLQAIEDATTKAVSKKVAEQIGLEGELAEAKKKHGGITIENDKITRAGVGYSGYEVKQLQGKLDRIKELNKQIEVLVKVGQTKASEIIAESGLDAGDVETKTPKGAKRDKLTAASALTPSGTTSEELKTWQKGQIRLMQEFALAWGLEWDNINNITTLKGDALAEAMRATQERLGHQTKTGGAKLEAEVIDMSGMVSGALVGLGHAIADALSGDEDFGKSMLKILGSFMQQLGAALITSGVGYIALQSGNPYLMIAGGVALVAAGALLSKSASTKAKLPGGGGSHSKTGATTTTPTSIQGQDGNGQLVATIRGQDLRFINQAAANSYGARG